LDGGTLAKLKLCIQLDTKPSVDSGFFCAEPRSPSGFFLNTDVFKTFEPTNARGFPFGGYG